MISQPLHDIKPTMRAMIENFRKGGSAPGETTSVDPSQSDRFRAHNDEFISEIQDFDGAKGWKKDQDPRTGHFKHNYTEEVSITDAGVYVTTEEVGDVGSDHANTERTITGDQGNHWSYTFGERTEEGAHRYITIHGEGIEYHGQAFEIAPDGTGTYTEIHPVRARGEL